MGYVYKYVLDGEIIYIGKTKQKLSMRISQHGKNRDNINEKYWDDINNSDIFYMEFADNYVVDMVETLLINKYQPRCNKAKFITSDIPIYFNEAAYEWKVFVTKNHQTNETLRDKYETLLQDYEKLKVEYSCLNKRMSWMSDIVKQYIYLLSELKNLEIFTLNSFIRNKNTRYTTEAQQRIEAVNSYVERIKECIKLKFKDYFDYVEQNYPTLYTEIDTRKRRHKIDNYNLTRIIKER